MKTKEEIKLKRREHYLKNAERIKAERREYRLKYPERRREASRIYGIRHAEEIKSRVKDRYIKNRDKHLKKFKEYHQKNLEKERKRCRKWYQDNIELAREISRRYRKTPEGHAVATNAHIQRRKLLRQEDNKVTAKELVELRQKHKRCYWCKRNVKELTLDHLIPLSKGGAHKIENLVMACRSCNSQKKVMDADDFARKKGLLFA